MYDIGYMSKVTMKALVGIVLSFTVFIRLAFKNVNKFCVCCAFCDLGVCNWRGNGLLWH